MSTYWENGVVRGRYDPVIIGNQGTYRNYVYPEPSVQTYMYTYPRVELYMDPLYDLRY